MRQDEIEKVRGELGSFVQEMLASLSRKDLRAKVGLHLPGLMLEGRRKPMQSTSERLRVDFQQLQQLVSSSPYSVTDPATSALDQGITEQREIKP